MDEMKAKISIWFHWYRLMYFGVTVYMYLYICGTLLYYGTIIMYMHSFTAFFYMPIKIFSCKFFV